MRQLKLVKNSKSAYGGALLSTRSGRSRPRPLATRHSMHVVLRSSKAKGVWSFKRSVNARKIESLIKKFSSRYGVLVHSSANVGNHIHLHLQLSNRYTYRPFIRALTGAIAMSITGVNRWNRLKTKLRFWDYRPFSRIALGWHSYLTLKNYVQLNQLEGLGYPRDIAQEMNDDAPWVDYNSA